MSQLRIGLFIGGSSSEKEISLESGRHVYNNLDRDKYEVLPIFVDRQHRFWVLPEPLLWKNTAQDIENELPPVENLSSSFSASRRIPAGRRERVNNENNSRREKNGEIKRICWEDLKSLIDFAFICLHGKFGEEAILGLFEILKIPNNGASVLGGALSMDKLVQRRLLVADGLNVPKHLGIDTKEWNSYENVSPSFSASRRIPAGRRERLHNDLIERVEREFGYPFMVKPSREGSSTALHKVKSRDEIAPAFEDAFRYDNSLVVEEFLEGMELTTLVYGFDDEVKALPPTQLLKGGDFLTAEEKFLPGGAQMITPPPLPEPLVQKIQKESIKAFKSLGLKVYSRIDSFLVGDLKTIEGSRVVILEPNNPPAMTPSTALWLQAAEAGYNASQFLDLLINLSLKAHSQKIGPL